MSARTEKRYMEKVILSCLKTFYHKGNLNAACDGCMGLFKKKRKKIGESFAVPDELY